MTVDSPCLIDKCLDPQFCVIFASACTGTTTVFWELYENFADHFLGTRMVRGLEDTLVDFILGISGALVLSVLYIRR